MISEEAQLELLSYMNEKKIIDFQFEYDKDADFYEFKLFKKQSYPVSKTTNFLQLKLFIDKSVELNNNGYQKQCPVCDENIVNGLGCLRCCEYCCTKCAVIIYLKNGGKTQCPVCRFIPNAKAMTIDFDLLNLYKHKLEQIKDFKNFDFDNFIIDKID